jgi:hypothetical protein
VDSGDANLRRISSSVAELSGVSQDFREIKVQVRNDSDHAASISVYVDANPPADGDCTPNGRILETVVSLEAFGTPGDQADLFPEFGSQPGFVEFSCANQYTLVAVVDINGDDSAACSEGNLGSFACRNALNDDDTDSSDNKAVRFAPRVKKP